MFDATARGGLLILGIMMLAATVMPACTEKRPPRPSVAQSLYEAHCKERLPVFTLGEHSSPSKDQEATLCACIWNHLGSWERETSQKMAQRKDSEVSSLYRTAFPSRFGKAIKECGGMDL
jgi:hypothetical protein